MIASQLKEFLSTLAERWAGISLLGEAPTLFYRG